MNTLLRRRERAQHDYERYEAHRRFEEATNIAERVGYPIRHRIAYVMRGGQAYAATDTRERPFRELTAESLEHAQRTFTGVNAFEIQRRELEHAESLLVEQLGRGELPGNVLVKMSPIPDAVREGRADIGGYRRDLLRSYVRIYYKQGDTVQCLLFTLDRSNQSALSAVGHMLGIDADQGSEAVLADYAVMDMSHVDDAAIDQLADAVIQCYDDVSFEQTGQQLHAGSLLRDRTDALSMVMSRGVLLDEHMQTINGIVGSTLPELREPLLEGQRRRMAAAIDELEHGGVVHSLGDAAVTARESQGNYDADCPPGSNAMALGREQDDCMFVSSICPICGTKNVTTLRTRGAIIGITCGCRVEADGRVKHGRRGRFTPSREARVTPKKARIPSKAEVIQKRYGRYAEAQWTTQFGSKALHLIDRRTGERLNVKPDVQAR